MARTKAVVEQNPDAFPSVQTQASELAAALRDAIQASKPAEKKTVFTRVENTPWTPPKGVAKLKLKRKSFQHGIPLSEKMLTNEQISLLNRLRPGSYLDGWVTVRRRRDKGIDVDYPIRSAQQRLKLVNAFGVRTFTELLQRLNDEADKPRRSEFDPAANDE